MLNKRGHIATWLIFIGALVLIIVSLTSFVMFNGKVDSKIGNFDKSYFEFSKDAYFAKNILEPLVSDTAKDSAGANFVSNFEDGLSKRAVVIDDFTEISGNLLAKLREKDYELTTDGDNYELKLQHVFVKSAAEGNGIYSSFDLCVRFNVKGEVSQCL